MKSWRRHFLSYSIVFVSIFIFTLSVYVNTSRSVESGDRAALLEGANQMMSGNKAIMDIVNKKGIKDPDLQAAEKMMSEGYDMIVKGEGMASGSSADEGKSVMTRGGKMMIDADKKTQAAIKRLGLTEECTGAFGTCQIGESKLKNGFQTYGLHGDWEPGGM